MNTEDRKPVPFLKWAGSKRQLVPEVLKYVPPNFGTYREPFLGGGALFFALLPLRAVLSDSNRELVATFRAVRDRVEDVVERLEDYQHRHSPREYDRVRRIPMGGRGDWPDDLVAARMIYLNKTCFNGLYRVNAGGIFNVPIGKFKTPPTICDAANLRACSQALQHATIVDWDFRYAISRSKAGDLIYCDPPYLPSSDTADFTKYTADGFTLRDHRGLAWACQDAKAHGATVVLSAAGNDASAKLYRPFGFQFHSVAARRAINSKGSARGEVCELICT
jgi:DNA adenine methylase